MPELPEVQTIVTGLLEKVLGKQISEILEYRENTVIWHVECAEFGKIISIDRRGKYIIFHLANGLKLVVHLRMTGKLIYEENLAKSSSHTRAEIIFEDDTKLIFDDVRTFGKIEVMLESAKNLSISKLGVEPLEPQFNYEYLEDKIKRRVTPIKNILLDQTVIAGIGNIYASEILFRAKIDPSKKGSNLSNEEIAKIVLNTKEILNEAIKCNGTTISDYRSVEDKTGEFQNFLKVYRKDYCECGNRISKIKISGRSTYFCDKCQKK